MSKKNVNLNRRNVIKGLGATALGLYGLLTISCSNLFKKSSTRAVANLADGTELPIQSWVQNCYQKFQNTNTSFSTDGFQSYSIAEQKKNFTNIDNFMRWSKKQMLIQPKDAYKHEQWKSKINQNGRLTFGNLINLTDKEMDVMVSTGILSMGGNFLAQVRNVKPGFSSSESFQAGRNVGAVGLLQIASGKNQASLNDAIFGYSMLYPLTDNYLDRTDISKLNKQDFAKRFRRRLSGEPSNALSPIENSMFEMVSYVEKTYPRDQYPEVFHSMVGIHDMQIESLSQQSSIIKVDYLRSSIQKGGASVLADAFMGLGKPTKEVCEFAFNIGFALQLFDDLQDVNSDIKNKHQTLFTQAAANDGNLDMMTSKLLNYWMSLIEESKSLPGFQNENGRLFSNILKKGGSFIILEAVAQSPTLFSSDFAKKVEPIMPIAFKNASSINIEKKFVAEYSQFPEQTIDMMITFGRESRT